MTGQIEVRPSATHMETAPRVFRRMSDETAIAAGRLIASISMLASVAAVVIVVVAGEPRLFYEEFGVPNVMGGFLFSLLLFTAISRQPRNGAIWAVGWSGALQALTMALAPALTLLLVKNQYGAAALADLRSIADPSPEIHFLIWLQEWTFIPALGLFMTFGFLLFPDGRLPSRRWRYVAWLAALSIGGATIGMISRTEIRPEGERSPAPMTAILLPVVLVAILLSLASLRARYRAASGDERHQLRWLAFGAMALCVPFLGAQVIDSLSSGGVFEPTLSRPTVIVVLPVLIGSYAIALFKYRLYDIDVVISKSVTYVGLAAVITAVFAAIVAIPTVIISESGEGGPGLLLPIVATAVVAVLFEPIRSRMQRWANRLVYGERSTPHEVLSQLTAQLSETRQRGGTNDLARLLAEGTGAESAAVWLQARDRLVREGVWPADGPAATSESFEALADDEFSSVTSVRHRDEVLGALSVTKPRNDPLTPADRELIADVAGGAGLMLRNVGLNRQLEERAEQVRDSRRRLIETQDAERHRLERDLHDGAQQQVVALKVKLGLAKTLADRAGADVVASLVSRLGDETQHAVDALRAVAHGIYPPLLEAEGLDATLRAVERTSSVPQVTVETTGLPRFERHVEESIYFCVIELIRGVADAGGTRVEVAVSEQAGRAELQVEADVTMEQLANAAIADRVAAADGSLVVAPTERGGRLDVVLETEAVPV